MSKAEYQKHYRQTENGKRSERVHNKARSEANRWVRAEFPEKYAAIVEQCWADEGGRLR